MNNTPNTSPVRSAAYARSASILAGQSGIDDQVDNCASAVADRNAPTRFAVYARCASPHAPDSIENQVNACSSWIADRFPHWELAQGAIFTDAGVPGLRSAGRQGLESLLEKVQQNPKPFTCVVMTSTDRLGRNLRDVLPIIDMLHHRGVSLCFVDQSLDSADPHFGFMRSVVTNVAHGYIEALRRKVRQGLKDRVYQGLSAGGRCFGYESMPIFQGDGSHVGAKTTVVPSEAAIVTRIYKDFACGFSAPQIARALNHEQVPPPNGTPKYMDRKPLWQSRHVYAILRRDQYRGTVVWGRSHTMKDPETGRARRCRLSEEKVVRVAAPDLAIVDAAVAKAVDERLAEMSGGAACHESSDDTPLFMPDVAKENG